jgi:hypothetical protein
LPYTKLLSVTEYALPVNDPPIAILLGGYSYTIVLLISRSSEIPPVFAVKTDVVLITSSDIKTSLPFPLIWLITSLYVLYGTVETVNVCAAVDAHVTPVLESIRYQAIPSVDPRSQNLVGLWVV